MLLHILFYDLWFYFSHILLHTNTLYQIVHKIHHQTPYSVLTYEDTNKAHILENFIQPLGIFIPFLFCKEKISISFIAASAFVYIRGMMRHDHRCIYWIGNHHILHHKYINCNYGEYWIDSLFGTVYHNPKEYVYGILYT